MIFEFLLKMMCGSVTALVSSVQIVTLPTDLIATLAKIVSYGNAIVGADVMIVFASSVMFWATLRASVGLFVFLWKLLPFT